MGHLGENIVASLLELIVLVAAGVGCWAMAKRKPLGLTPFLVTVVSFELTFSMKREHGVQQDIS